MKLYIDREADALFLRLDSSRIVESEEVTPGVVLDFDEHNQVVGIEILRLSTRTPSLDLDQIQLQTV
jgi:uncharacterized protein YuzE